MEPDEDKGSLGNRGRGKREEKRPELGFQSCESLQVLGYLQNVQKFQLKLLCLRVRRLVALCLCLCVVLMQICCVCRCMCLYVCTCLIIVCMFVLFMFNCFVLVC